jgi:hypothetical protein
MSSISFLFGNIDKTGKLDETQVADDLLQILSSHDTAEYLNKVLQTPLGDHEIIVDTTDNIIPVSTAVDYQDEQEMVEDLAPKPSQLKPTYFKPQFITPTTNKKAAVKIEGRLKFSEIFASHIQPQVKTFRQKNLVVPPQEIVPVVDDAVEFQQPFSSRCSVFLKEQEIQSPTIAESVEEVLEEKVSLNNDNILSSVMLDPWEEKIIYDYNAKESLSLPAVRMFRNELLENDDWTKASIYI